MKSFDDKKKISIVLELNPKELRHTPKREIKQNLLLIFFHHMTRTHPFDSKANMKKGPNSNSMLKISTMTVKVANFFSDKHKRRIFDLGLNSKKMFNDKFFNYVPRLWAFSKYSFDNKKIERHSCFLMMLQIDMWDSRYKWDLVYIRKMMNWNCRTSDMHVNVGKKNETRKILANIYDVCKIHKIDLLA